MRIRQSQVLALALTAILAPVAGASDIFDNGGIFPSNSTLSGVAALFGTTWSELQHDGAGTANTNSGLGSGTPSLRLADDFTLTSDATIREIALYAYQTGAVYQTITGVNVRIFSGGPPPGGTLVFGDTTTNRLNTIVDTKIIRTFSTVVPAAAPPQPTRSVYEIRALIETAPGVGLTLPAGTYWLDFQFSQNPVLPAGIFTPSVTISGSRGLPTYNGIQSNNNGTSYTGLIDAGNPATGPDVPIDLPFIVRDAITPPVVPCLADINGDLVVDVLDLLGVITAWGNCP